MLELNFVHWCEYAFILKNGTAGTIGIFRKVKAQKLPASRRASIVLNIHPGDLEPHELKIIVESPSGKEIIPPFEEKLGPAGDRDQDLGFILDIPNLTLEEEGVYKAGIFIDGKRLQDAPFNFKVMKE